MNCFARLIIRKKKRKKSVITEEYWAFKMRDVHVRDYMILELALVFKSRIGPRRNASCMYVKPNTMVQFCKINYQSGPSSSHEPRTNIKQNNLACQPCRLAFRCYQNRFPCCLHRSSVLFFQQQFSVLSLFMSSALFI